MRKLTLLITALLLTAFGVKATAQNKELKLSDATKVWNGEKLTISDDGTSFTFNAGQQAMKDESGNEMKGEDGETIMEDLWGNAAVSWFGDLATDISEYKYIVLELAEATTADIELGICTAGFWGNKHLAKLTQGETKLELKLSDLTLTEGDDKGQSVKLSAVNLIFIRTGWVHEQTVKIKTCYLTKDSSYDKILTGAKPDASLFPLTEGALDLGIYNNGTWTNTYDASTKTLTFGGDYGAAGWTYSEAKDISAYKNIVLELQQPIGYYACLRFESDGKIYSTDLNQTGTKVRVDLTEAIFSEGDNKNQTLDRTKVTKIYIWNAWNGEKELKLREVYLESASEEADYLLRENTKSKYGTVCLPFAAAKPINATIYKVAGVDSKTNPSKLYLESVESLEAGKAYIYHSDDAYDVKFTKTNTETNLESASASTDLIGNFDETTATEGNYILVSNQWKKAKSTSKVGKYRASLSLNGVSETPESTGSKYAVMGLESGEVTGINGVKANNAKAAYHTLGGVRVAQPAKGLYIVNGKKAIVK